MTSVAAPQFSQPTPTVALEDLAALLNATLTQSPEARARAEARHRALVIEDDYLCETFGFSRRARGKFLLATPNT